MKICALKAGSIIAMMIGLPVVAEATTITYNISTFVTGELYGYDPFPNIPSPVVGTGHYSVTFDPSLYVPYASGQIVSYQGSPLASITIWPTANTLSFSIYDPDFGANTLISLTLRPGALSNGVLSSIGTSDIISGIAIEPYFPAQSGLVLNGNTVVTSFQTVFNSGASLGGSGRLGITFPSAPEPASWAMMIVGFGAIGASMRRRQRVDIRFG